jgi:SAM-dependent methyltransferase
LGIAFRSAGLPVRNRAERIPEEPSAPPRARPESACAGGRRRPQRVWLAEFGLDVLSLNFSANALKKARALAALRRVDMQFQQVDLATWPWPTAEFDVIVAIFIQFADPPFRQGIFEGIKRALKPGGLLLMQGYRPEQLAYRTGGPSQVENLYTTTLLEESFSDLAAIEINEHDSTVDEGGGHAGMSALIDFVGRK